MPKRDNHKKDQFSLVKWTQRSPKGWPYIQKFKVPNNASSYKVSCFYHQRHNFFTNLQHYYDLCVRHKE